MPITIALPLDLPAVRVWASPGWEDGTLLIEVESPLRAAPCPRCGRAIDRFHGLDRPIGWRHGSVLGREVGIEIRPQRYRGPDGEGGPTPTPRGAWYEPHRPHPIAFEPEAWKRLGPGTGADVSRPLARGVKAVEGIGDPPVAPVVDGSAFAAWETLGIDERAWLQGHGDSVAVVWARDAAGHTHVRAVRPHRLQATVQAFLETIPDRLKAPVQRVCIDRWEGDAGAGAAALPQAPGGVDRFPVAVHSRNAGDERRKEEGRRLNAERSPEPAVPTAELRPLRRREWRSWNPDPPGPVVELCEQTPAWASAQVLRTLLTAIFDRTRDRATAQSRRQLWVEQVKVSGLSCFDKFLNTLHNWQDGILHQFEGGHTSGFVEGLNHKLKLLKRRCFGWDDPVELFRRRWLDIEGARLWA